jgi:hypothetical protein
MGFVFRAAFYLLLGALAVSAVAFAFARKDDVAEAVERFVADRAQKYDVGGTVAIVAAYRKVHGEQPEPDAVRKAYDEMLAQGLQATPAAAERFFRDRKAAAAPSGPSGGPSGRPSGPSGGPSGPSGGPSGPSGGPSGPSGGPSGPSGGPGGENFDGGEDGEGEGGEGEGGEGDSDGEGRGGYGSSDDDDEAGRGRGGYGSSDGDENFESEGGGPGGPGGGGQGAGGSDGEDDGYFAEARGVPAGGEEPRRRDPFLGAVSAEISAIRGRLESLADRVASKARGAAPASFAGLGAPRGRDATVGAFRRGDSGPGPAAFEGRDNDAADESSLRLAAKPAERRAGPAPSEEPVEGFYSPW